MEAAEACDKAKLEFDHAVEAENQAEKDLQMSKSRQGGVMTDDKCANLLEVENWNRATEKVCWCIHY